MQQRVAGREQQPSARRGIIIRLEGAFDAAALRRVSELLAEARPGDRVTIDLSKVRDMDDYSVARLAEWAGGPVQVEIRGLRQHQLRLLQYFGVAPAL